jgi:hypothetical protein
METLAMSTLQSTTAAIQSLAAPGMLLAMFFGADSLLGKDASKALSDAIDDAARKPNESSASKSLEQFLDDNFSPKNGRANYLISIFLLTIFSLLFFLALYTARMTSLIDQLMSKGFLAQFIGDGLVITFAVNYFTFSQYKNLLSVFAKDSLLKNFIWILADICLKCLLFAGLTTIIYAAFALIGGAFHGNVATAAGAVPRTIWNALFFENLTSVYIYSMLLSSVPICLVVIVKLMIHSNKFASFVQKLLFLLPVKEKPIRAATCLFAGVLGLFGVIASLMLRPLT